MPYSVFMHRSDSIYDDSPAERYQFPKQYLSRAKKSVGDWIVYLEPTKVQNSRGYFAIAKIDEIVPDPKKPEMFVALIEKGSYLDFPNSVLFNQRGMPVERGLLNENGKLSGRAQSAVRPISPKDFDRILDIGLSTDEALLPRHDKDYPNIGFSESDTKFSYDFERDRMEFRVSRAVRDRAFRQIVLSAYGERCAVSGLKFINGGGRAEVQAAHIRPVEFDGPDIVQNGIALSGTAHWMFDRGLISLSDDLEILISRQANDREGIQNFVSSTGTAMGPKLERLRPAAQFLSWHRKNVFKQ